jgi:hypothetical protein
MAGCAAFTNTVQGTGTSISGPYVTKAASTFTVTGAAPGYAQYGTPGSIQWRVDGAQKFNTCTSPSTCTFTLPVGYTGTNGIMAIKMVSNIYSLPDFSVSIIP